MQGKGPGLTAPGAEADHSPASVQAGSHGRHPAPGWGGAGGARSAVGDVSPTQPVDGRSEAWCPVGKGGSVPQEGLRSCGPPSHVWSTGNTPQTLPLPVSAWLPAWASGCLFAVPARHPQGPKPLPDGGFPRGMGTARRTQSSCSQCCSERAANSPGFTLPRHAPRLRCCGAPRSPLTELEKDTHLPVTPDRSSPAHKPPSPHRLQETILLHALPADWTPTLVRNTLPVSRLQGAAPVGLDASKKS